MKETTAVPLRSWMSRVAIEGIMSAQACGKITRIIRRVGERLSAIAASHCPGATVLIEDRTTSAE